LIEPEVALKDLIQSITVSAGNSVVEAIFAGAETGVELADKLSERMGLRTNGTALSEARRNKYVMGETIRRAGIRAVRQLRSALWGEISDWLKEWNPDPFRVIVKPLDSAGSEDVTLCNNLSEVQIAYGNIMGKVNGLGLVNRAVLVQEYLDGQEYVIDMVSRDGVHKTVAIWAYDRRPANGASFVCFGQRLLTMDDPHTEELVAYQSRVLTALGILNGPSHGELKWYRNEPVLIEVGARCHGGEGAWLQAANTVYGYNQLDVSIDCYLDPKAFNSIPMKVINFQYFNRVSFYFLIMI
jgi:biotin carboxylase